MYEWCVSSGTQNAEEFETIDICFQSAWKVFSLYRACSILFYVSTVTQIVWVVFTHLHALFCIKKFCVICTLLLQWNILLINTVNYLHMENYLEDYFDRAYSLINYTLHFWYLAQHKWPLSLHLVTHYRWHVLFDIIYAVKEERKKHKY